MILFWKIMSNFEHGCLLDVLSSSPLIWPDFGQHVSDSVRNRTNIRRAHSLLVASTNHTPLDHILGRLGQRTRTTRRMHTNMLSPVLYMIICMQIAFWRDRPLICRPVNSKFREKIIRVLTIRHLHNYMSPYNNVVFPNSISSKIGIELRNFRNWLRLGSVRLSRYLICKFNYTVEIL